MKKAVMSDKRDPEDRSDKDCVCGGHNLNNPKSNKRHSGTKRKLNVRRARKGKRR